MKRLIVLLCLLTFPLAALAANVNPKDFSSATTPLAGTELIPVYQGGAWKKTTAGNVGGVQSFNNRTGAISPAAGDYTAAQVGAYPVVYPTVGVSASADTAAINAALLNGSKHVFISGNATINAPLIVYSNTWLELAPQATITADSAATTNMLQSYAYANGSRTVTDAGITSGAATLTSATASFVSGDVGHTVKVVGAGPAGATYLYATINSVTNSTTAVLNLNAGATVTNASCTIYSRDTNIKITGGTWDRGTVTASNSNAHVLMLRRIDGLVVQDATIKTINSASSKYCIAPGDVTNGVISNITYNSTSDGVHVHGPANNITIRDQFGTTNDDMVAFTSYDNPAAYDDVHGDITNITVDGVYGTAPVTSLIRISGGTGYKTRNVLIRNMYGSSPIGISCHDETWGTVDVSGLVVDGIFGSLP